MDNVTPTLDLRQKYNKFIFDSFHVDHNADGLHVEYVYKLGEYTFKPTVDIPITDIRNEWLNNDFIDYLFFNFGIINAINYYKLSCAPNFVILAGTLTDEQRTFFQKLFYHGLGELMYVNKFDIPFADFINISAVAPEKVPEFKIGENFHGNLIPVGGGKDSVVTLEALQPMHEDNLCLQFNRNIYPENRAALDCIKLAGYGLDKTVNFNLSFDPLLFDLNKQGFYNGHVPFSSCLAFASIIMAYLNNKKYIVLSNEASANEGNVAGSDVNHQYSKSFEFESDFQNYVNKFITTKIYYFSLLRCMNEYAIVQRFISHPMYLNVFRSCNVGTKENKWCGACAKCLYVYIMLYPFVSAEDLNKIFGYDLLENANLLPLFIGLVNPDAVKPFECVGTKEEIKYSLNLALAKFDNKDDLPYLLKYYNTYFYRADEHFNVEHFFNPEHHIPPEYLKLLYP